MLGTLALAALVAMPSFADDKKKDEEAHPHAKPAHVDTHANTHPDHGGPHGINPAVPAAVGTALGVLGALGAFSPPPGPPPGAAPPYQPAAMPPPADFRYTARPTWLGPDGRPCRQYQATVPTSTGPEPHFGAACQGPDGVWRVVN